MCGQRRLHTHEVERLQAEGARVREEAQEMQRRADAAARDWATSSDGWRRRIAEAEARGAAGVDLATQAKVDFRKAEVALQAPWAPGDLGGGLKERRVG